MQTAKSAKTVQIAFNSDAYFEFLKTHPEAAQWLSLGNNITLVLDNTIYEIKE